MNINMYIRKTVILVALLLIANNGFSQLTLTDSIKNIKGVNYKISYAVNKSEKDTFKFVYYNNTSKTLYTETIITVPPKSCAITGFAQLTPVTKFQATTDKVIIDELKAKAISYDATKIGSSANGTKLEK
jgi:hypothetical protein